MFIENGTDPGSKQLHGHSYRWGLTWIDWKPLCRTKKFLKVVFIPVSHRKSTRFFFSFGCKNSMCCHWGHGVSAQATDFYDCWLYEIFSTIHRKDLKYVKLISFLFFFFCQVRDFIALITERGEMSFTPCGPGPCQHHTAPHTAQVLNCSKSTASE